ncbi:unnamed protein product [Paramecium sonneborni]|uniref:Uncharacterized protein n=1 Tax=Paramecium sonneborni TaxID=65129 RepID=A0A8S1M5G3_9CILI|nr:unnamed protein product [Paramecium sonneborni]
MVMERQTLVLLQIYLYIYGKKLYPDGLEQKEEYLYGSHHSQGIQQRDEL